MNENEDITEDTIYGINSEQQHKIKEILSFLNINTRKTQNINYLNFSVRINYFPKSTKEGIK